MAREPKHCTCGPAPDREMRWTAGEREGVPYVTDGTVQVRAPEGVSRGLAHFIASLLNEAACQDHGCEETVALLPTLELPKGEIESWTTFQAKCACGYAGWLVRDVEEAQRDLMDHQNETHMQVRRQIDV